MADQQLLQRIISNLLLNSLQAKKDHAELQVKVTLERKDNCVLLSVADNGTGIDKQLQDKIFLPHFSTKKSGSGLGLAIAKQGIEQMGGSIYFESALGSGTVFYIELPINE
jgi:signal transduction histidine kinase